MAFSQSDLYLTKHLVVISLMSRVSINLELDFMQVKAWREQRTRCSLLAVKQTGKEGQLFTTQTSAPRACSSVLATNKLRIKQMLLSIF